MATDVLSTPAPADAGRVSRYRSVRKVQLQSQRAQCDQPPPPPLPTQFHVMAPAGSGQHALESPPKDRANVGRTASRYRRPTKPQTSNEPLPSASHPPLPSVPPGLGTISMPTEQRRLALQKDRLVPMPQPGLPARQPDLPSAFRRPPVGPVQKFEQERLRQESQLAAREDTRKREEARRSAEKEVDRQRRIADREAQEHADAYEQMVRERAAKELEDKKRLQEADARRDRERARDQEREQSSAPPVESDAGIRSAQRNRLQKEDRRRPSMAENTVNADFLATSPPLQGRWGLFKRRKADDSNLTAALVLPLTSPTSTTDSRPRTSHGASVKSPVTVPLPQARKSADGGLGSELPTIKPGGGGVVPCIDAPISAVNADGRRVMVECNSSRLRFPVDPDTTPLQLIRSASNCMAENFDPRASILVEVYAKANVERPLRMYEHVRDVMNSWDSDEQHSLVIVPSTPDGDKELYAAWAPKKQPHGASWVLYYSNKPGRWDKKVVTLKSDGQLVCDKSNGKDTMNICHLSDFDIYSIMPKRMKKVNPKKKYCYAIKSQQKSNMFMDTSSFIHLFAVGDQQTADQFHHAVRDWRSWYLVDVMGEGRKPNAPQKTIEGVLQSATGEPDDMALQARLAPLLKTGSRDSHYILGTFNTLDIDVDGFTYGNDAKQETRPSVSELKDNQPLGLAVSQGLGLPSAVEHTKKMHARRLSERKRSAPPISFPKTMRHQNDSISQSGGHSQHNSVVSATDRRLGREIGDSPQTRTIRDGNGGHGGLVRTNSVRSTRSTATARISSDGSGSGSGRTNSIRGQPAMPKPLVDLTPQFKEAPQFLRKGRGVRPDNVGPGGLIDAIASPEDPISAPASRDWKRPQTSAGAKQADVLARESSLRRQQNAHHQHHPSLMGYDRTKSLKGHGVKLELSSPTHPAFGGDEAAFTGGGLLANAVAKQGWGAGDKGHGRMRGSDAKGPMVDLKERSKFAEGSLLAKMNTER